MWHAGGVSKARAVPSSSASSANGEPGAVPRDLDDEALDRAPRRRAPEPRGAALAWAAFGLPAALALWNAVPSASWRADVATVTIFSGTSRFQGVVSGALGQVAQLVPIGSGLERAALPSALSLGVLGVLVFRACLGLFVGRAAPRLGPLLSLSAAVSASLCVTALLEGTVTGGLTVATALGLGTLVGSGLLAPRAAGERALSDARRAGVVGALLGLTALESWWAAAAVGPALFAGLLARGVRPPRAQTLVFGAALALTTTLGVLPSALRPLVAPLEASVLSGISGGGGASQRAGAPALGPSLGASGTSLGADTASGSAFALRGASAAGDVSAQGAAAHGAQHDSAQGAASGARPPGEAGRFVAPSRWLGALGLFALVAALVGSAWAFTRPALRVLLAPVTTLLVFDVLVPSAPPNALIATGRVAPHLLALAALVVLAALGVHALVVSLSRLALPGARGAAALLVAFTLAASWAGAEDSMRVLSSRNTRATEVWTDEALAVLPPDSLVVVRSEPLAFRLWAARAVGGRADVLVVPLPLLGQGTLAADLLELEPKLGLLIRELSISGVPSEQALSELSDARPLFIDVDAGWDRRLLEHLLPGTFFSRFAPHALGRSDRKAALEASLRTLDRVLERSDAFAGPDEATRTVLLASGAEQLALLEVLGDRAEAATLRQRLGRLAPSPKPAGIPVALR